MACKGVLAAREGEDDAIDDNRGLRGEHVVGEPCGGDLGLVAFAGDLHGDDAAVGRGAVGHWEGYGDFASGGGEEPAGAILADPARHAAPGAFGLEVDVGVRDDGAAVGGGHVVGSAEGFRIGDEEAAFLAGGDDELVAFIGEDDGAGVHVEVALGEPLVVGGGVVVLEGEGTVRHR